LVHAFVARKKVFMMDIARLTSDLKWVSQMYQYHLF
jgi:hypothetical protein